MNEVYSRSNGNFSRVAIYLIVKKCFRNRQRQCNMKLLKIFIPFGTNPSLPSLSSFKDGFFHFYHSCEIEVMTVFLLKTKEK